jgi:uncharacterized Zn-finger protein
MHGADETLFRHNTLILPILCGFLATRSSISAANLGIQRQARYGAIMSEAIVPHFHNDLGVAVIEIGAQEFMCVGALPPFDHPHVYCDMGGDKEYVCPYCSTLYRHDPALAPRAARPAECALIDTTV